MPAKYVLWMLSRSDIYGWKEFNEIWALEGYRESVEHKIKQYAVFRLLPPPLTRIYASTEHDLVKILPLDYKNSVGGVF